MPDHIHLFISTLPTIAPTEIVKILKSVSANEIFKAFQNLNKIFYKSNTKVDVAPKRKIKNIFIFNKNDFFTNIKWSKMLYIFFYSTLKC